MRFIIALSLLFLPQIILAQTLLPHVYLTFEEVSTSNSITINFMTEGKSPPSFVYLDVVPQDDTGNYQQRVETRTSKVKKVDKSYHHAKVDGLSANTTYYFYVGDETIGFSEKYKFKTLPDDDSEIRIVQGGDMGTDPRIIGVSESAIWESPHVILLGGDLAYADGKADKEHKWMEWFEIMNQVMISPDGFLIPLIVAIGNHETTVGIAPLGKNPFYKALFPQHDGRTYFVKTLGSHTMLMVLDSGHYKRHKKQKDFIQQTFLQYNELPNKLALYHAPLYPNHRGPNDYLSTKGKRHWLPLFDKYGLTAAFENHDHTLKRTKVLRGDEVSEKGTVYVGDGCWGKNARENKDHWYLEVSKEATHVWSASVRSDSISFSASGVDGEVFDEFNLYNSPSRTVVEPASATRRLASGEF